MSATRMFRAFSAELMKIASKIQDADIQALLAHRRGEEYLQGGRLPTNTMEEGAPTYHPNTAGQVYKFAAYTTVPLGLATGSYDFSAKKKKKNHYQNVRDYAVTGMKGGLTGLGVLGAVNTLRGRFGSPSDAASIRATMKAARGAAATGAGLALADRAYRHDDIPGTKTAGVVSPSQGNLRSPASQLAQSRQTGGFKSRVVHGTGGTPKVVQLGRKFRIP